MSLLELSGVAVHYPQPHGWLRAASPTLRAVDGVDLTIARGETLGLVGESGCGKTSVGRAVLRLAPLAAGTVRFAGEDLASLPPGAWRQMRRRIQLVFQDPYASLNPRLAAGDAIAEPIRVHGLRRTEAAVRARAAELLEAVGLSAGQAGRYPHEFSGGQRQRIGIARALACEPELIVCDEPVSALDVSIQAQVVNLLQDLQEQIGLTYLFIAHGLGVIRHVSTHVAVMYKGRIVETGPRDALYAGPRHPYTRALLSAVPVPDPRAELARRRILLSGDASAPPVETGCRFAPRCPVALPACHRDAPALEQRPGAAHPVACWRAPEMDELLPCA